MSIEREAARASRRMARAIRSLRRALGRQLRECQKTRPGTGSSSSRGRTSPLLNPFPEVVALPGTALFFDLLFRDESGDTLDDLFLGGVTPGGRVF